MTRQTTGERWQPNGLSSAVLAPQAVPDALTELGATASDGASGERPPGRRWGTLALAGGAVLILAVAGYLFWRGRAAGSAVPTHTTAVVASGTVARKVTGVGTVALSQVFNVVPTTAGTLTEISVRVGDPVKSGQVLARIGSPSTDAALAQAQANLTAAQSKLAQAQKPYTEADVAAQRASVAAAKASLDAAEHPSSDADVVSARAGLASALASLRQAQQPYTAADLASARAAVSSAELALDAAQHPYTEADVAAQRTTVANAQNALVLDQRALENTKTQAAAALVAALSSVDKARNDRYSVQISRDKTCSRPDNLDCKAANASTNSAETSVRSAEDAVEPTRRAGLQSVAAAQSQVEQDANAVRAAQAKLDAMQAPPTRLTVDAATGSLEAARAKLAVVAAGAIPAEVDGANASVLAARTKLDGALAGGKPVSVAAEAPSVAAVAPEVVKNAQVVAGRQNANVRIDGTSPSYPRIRKFDVAQGRFFSEAEAREGALVAVLGASTAQSLFPDGDAVGQPLVVNQVPFEVVGVLTAKGLSGPESRDAVVFVPIVAAQYRLVGSQSVGTINVEARSLAQMSDAKDEITALLSRRHAITSGGELDFFVSSQEDVLATSSGVADTFTVLLAGIAGVSLLVGGIGIMNIMLVSVTERTREIGIRKAIGATRAVILTQFLIEATVLSLAGGVVGVLGGVGAARLVGAIAGWPTHADPLVALVAVAFSAGIGLFFGIYPARRAARLEPIEALRFE